jgi:hypothetical protein
MKKENREFESEIQRRLQPSVDRFAGRVGPFSLGSMEDLVNEISEELGERQPLIGNENTIRSRVVHTFQNASTSESVSDEAFLRHRSEYMFMSTFKPRQVREGANAIESKV